MNTLSLDKRIYRIDQNAKEISDKIDELTVVLRLMGNSISFVGRNIHIQVNGTYLLSISFKLNRNNKITKFEFNIYNKKLERKIQKKFNKEAIIRTSGHKISFIVKDMSEMPQILDLIMLEV